MNREKKGINWVNSAIFIILVSSLLIGCRSGQRDLIKEVPVRSDVELKMIHKERIDTLYVGLPAQRVERTSYDSVSNLETDYARSEARINPDGTLTHTISHRATGLPVTTRVITDTVLKEEYVEIPVRVEIPKLIERSPTPWEKVRLRSWGWLVGLVVILLMIILYKPLSEIKRY